MYLLLFEILYQKFKIMGIGDWGLGIGDWGWGLGPNPQSPIPNPQSPINIFIFFMLLFIKSLIKYIYLINNNLYMI